MVKFISVKAVVLVGISLLCLGGAAGMLFITRGQWVVRAPVAEAVQPEVLGATAQGVEARVLAMEALLEESTAGNQGEIKALKQQVKSLQARMKELAKRLERHEKKVDNKLQRNDNIAKVEKQVPPKRSPVSSHAQYHVVKNGETLYRISKKYKISERELIRLNGLQDKARIFIGQKLRVTR